MIPGTCMTDGTQLIVCYKCSFELNFSTGSKKLTLLLVFSSSTAQRLAHHSALTGWHAHVMARLLALLLLDVVASSSAEVGRP